MEKLVIVDRYFVSWQLIASSLWASWVLAKPPSNFTAFPIAFKYVSGLGLSEELISGLLLVGVLLHLSGLLLRLVFHALCLARFLGFVGVSIQTIFWSYMGGSSMVANPDTLFAAIGLVLGVGGAWRLCRYGWAKDV